MHLLRLLLLFNNLVVPVALILRLHIYCVLL